MIKKAFLVLSTMVILLLVVLLFNTLTFSSKQKTFDTVPLPEVGEEAITRFSRAIQFSTISFGDPNLFDPEPFLSLHDYVELTYAAVDSLLTRQIINDYTLLYQWEGQNPDLKPILVYGHMDVVPVDSATYNDWEAPPFSGIVKNGKIYGRGALDDKVSMMGILEAVEMLLRTGFQPERTIYLGFGHDEEIGGTKGAAGIVQYFLDNKITLEYSVDEGIPIVQGLVPGISDPIAMIGTAEKGYVSFRLTLNTPGGHSSSPSPDNTIGSLARAIVKLEDNQFPYELEPPVDQQIEYLGPEMSFFYRLFFANTWLFGSQLAKGLNAHTTTAPTIIEGGIKDNVIPTTASVVVNFRIMPGQSINEVRQHIESTVNDDRITIEPLQEEGNEPSMVSEVEAEGYLVIEKTLREIHQDIVVSPGLVPGGTDSKHFTKVAVNCYRFNPAQITMDNASGFHGINENIAVESYKKAILFYYQLIRNI